MTNNALSILDLRDIVIPDPVGLWPPAPFVWVLIGAAGVGLAVSIGYGYALWKAGAYRREGLAHLKQIEERFMTSGREIVALHELSILLKRVALVAFPRKQVAPLYGEKWLRFLDRTCEGCTFVTGPGHLLTAGIYAGEKVSQVSGDDCKQLVTLTRTWIKKHRSSKDHNAKRLFE
jgi:hypothetical protein